MYYRSWPFSIVQTICHWCSITIAILYTNWLTQCLNFKSLTVQNELRYINFSLFYYNCFNNVETLPPLFLFWWVAWKWVSFPIIKSPELFLRLKLWCEFIGEGLVLLLIVLIPSSKGYLVRSIGLPKPCLPTSNCHYHNKSGILWERIVRVEWRKGWGVKGVSIVDPCKYCVNDNCYRLKMN